MTEYWRDDLVGFLTGCSFSFKGALLRLNIEVRHISCGVAPQAVIMAAKPDFGALASGSGGPEISRAAVRGTDGGVKTCF